MGIGALLLKLRQTFEHGVRAAYYRDIVRHRITSTEPIRDLTDTTSEIHVLTSSEDWVGCVPIIV